MAWALKRLPYAIRAETAWPVGIVRDGTLAAVVIYHELRDVNIEMSIVADTPRWASRQTVAFLLGFPFWSWGVRRVTALIERKNKRSRKLVEGVGFKLEGAMRDAFPGDDAMVYGLTRRVWSRSRWYAEPPAEQKAA